MFTISGSSSNWILMSVNHSGSPQDSQTQVISKYTFLNSSHILYIYISTLCQVNLQNQSLHKHKTFMYTQTSDTNFRRVSPFNITPVKRAHKARTCWYCRPFCLIYQYQVKEKYKKGMARCNIKLKNIIIKTSAIWQEAVHTTNHHLLAAQQEPYKKA